MRTRKMYLCPNCGQQIPDSRNQWALWQIDEPFRCARCSTMLRMSISWWSTCLISVMIPLLIVVEIGILAFANDFVIGSGWIAAIQKFGLVIAVWWLAVCIIGNAPGHHLIVHSDE